MAQLRDEKVAKFLHLTILKQITKVFAEDKTNKPGENTTTFQTIPDMPQHIAHRIWGEDYIHDTTLRA